MKKGGEVQRAYIGVTTAPVTKQIAQDLNLPADKGALVQEVAPGSPAAEGRPRGRPHRNDPGDHRGRRPDHEGGRQDDLEARRRRGRDRGQEPRRQGPDRVLPRRHEAHHHAHARQAPLDGASPGSAARDQQPGTRATSSRFPERRSPSQAAPLTCDHLRDAPETGIKVCGVTRPEDARSRWGWAHGRSGLNFYAGSPRVCDLAVAEQIGASSSVRPRWPECSSTRRLTMWRARPTAASLTLLQLHGDEGPAFCMEAARRTGAKVMKATRVKDAHSVTAVRAYSVDYHLLDAYRAGIPGGTGKPFDWGFVKQYERSVPLVLAGGLTPGNVAEAIAATQPFAVDTASGTEAEPGRKDPDLLGAFFAAVERAGVSAPAPELATPMEAPSNGAPERRFGPYGGRYVPETLIPALDELERAWSEARADPDVPEPPRRVAARLRRPPDAALPRRAALRGGRPQRLPQARGPAPHRRPQVQQRARPGAARPADGQAADHRRDGRRPARRRHRDGVRAARTRLRRLHGHRGHASPAPERRAHGPARRRGRAGRDRRTHAQGGRLRGDPGLGRERRRRATTSSARPSARRRSRRSCATSSA